jgi:signal transduction histidine kinase
VKGYIKGIQDGIANTPEKVDRYLRTAYDKAGEMDVLLQRLFFFSNMETGNMMLSKKPLDLRDLTRYYVDEASLEPRMQQIVFETDFPTEPCVVSADAQMLRRVFNNLTENAVKYSGADPLHIHIALRNEGDACVITFRDNGRGVEEHQLRSLFDQFWRADSARQQEGGSSTGLGLYIVKYIIDSHGGSVTADNDGGLRMTFRLPRAKEEQQ